MGFPRPQFAGAKEPAGNAMPGLGGSAGPDMQKPLMASANDDPFAAISAPQAPVS